MQNSTLVNALQIIQIIISVMLILVIILQARGMGNLFTGDAGMGITKTRRGLEKTLFQVTILLSMLFLLNSVVQLMIQH